MIEASPVQDRSEHSVRMTSLEQRCFSGTVPLARSAIIIIVIILFLTSPTSSASSVSSSYDYNCEYKCNQDRFKIATAIGESLEQALRFKCCPAPRKFSHQNFVDYVNSVNVACKGHISGICAHQNHQNNQSSAEWEALNMIKSVTPLLDKKINDK